MDKHTKRPVCFSLHKYFKKTDCAPLGDAQASGSQDAQAEGSSLVAIPSGSQVAVQAEPEPRASWKQAAQDSAHQQSEAVRVATESNPKAHVQLVPKPQERCWNGGRG